MNNDLVGDDKITSKKALFNVVHSVYVSNAWLNYCSHLFEEKLKHAR